LSSAADSLHADAEVARAYPGFQDRPVTIGAFITSGLSAPANSLLVPQAGIVGTIGKVCRRRGNHRAARLAFLASAICQCTQRVSAPDACSVELINEIRDLPGIV
jgi:hypothetical protein